MFSKVVTDWPRTGTHFMLEPITLQRFAVLSLQNCLSRFGRQVSAWYRCSSRACGLWNSRQSFEASVLFGNTPAQAERLGHLVSRVSAFNVVITEPVKVAVSIHFECVIVDLAKDNDLSIGLFDVRERNRERSFTEFALAYTTAFSNFRVHQFRQAEARLLKISDAHPLVQRLAAICRHYQTNTNR